MSAHLSGTHSSDTHSSDTRVLGTRRSKLALWQTEHVQSLLQATHPQTAFDVQIFVTKGDKIIDKPLPEIGGKGLFTLELENALRGGEIDIAVHSLKDLPTESPGGLTLGAIPARENPADVLISRSGLPLDKLPSGARIGTSSRRRAAQLLHFRPDFEIIDIRGNVDTRLAKTLDPNGPYDGAILAYAGLHRLELGDVITQVLPDEIMLPAPGQGALGIQCRDEADSSSLLSPIHHADAAAEVNAERSFLAGLGGGCSTPVGSRGQIKSGRLMLVGRVLSMDGTQMIEVEIEGSVDQAEALGATLAEEALKGGAAEILGENDLIESSQLKAVN